MTVRTYLKIATPLTLAGVVFSGYLSSVRFFSNSCAFDEPCPMFLGYSACYFGFVMFLSMFLISLSSLLRKSQSRRSIGANLMIAALGTLFAGYFAVDEIKIGLSQGFSVYGLGLSTCVYGAVFFVAILGITVKAYRTRPELHA
jgi:hypothetical protein